jgi:GDP-D-mannose dehydratase
MLGFYIVKILSIFFVSLLYFIFGTGLSVFLEKIISKEDPNLLRPVDVTLQIPSVDKFYEKTNWKPKYNIEDSVQLLLDYYRNQ